MSNKVLIHTCCAPCLSFSIKNLIEEEFKPVVYFYNPNIHPEHEYEIRQNELIDFCEKQGYKYIVETPDVKNWYKKIEGYENEPEKGSRCSLCFDMRLEKTAQYAKDNGFDYFTTTLTISPHKSFNVIAKIANNLAIEYGVKYLEKNFKKNDGFKKSLEISKKHNMYRQEYCGCEFSIR